MARIKLANAIANIKDSFTVTKRHPLSIWGCADTVEKHQIYCFFSLAYFRMSGNIRFVLRIFGLNFQTFLRADIAKSAF